MTDIRAASGDAGSTTARPPAEGRRQRRERHPLLHVFPLGVMVLATFLVVFALMMARLQSTLPAPATTGGNAALVQRRSGVVLTTTPSGRVIESHAVAGSSPAAGAASSAVLTRASTAAGAVDD